jgi:hypothetical protein
MMPAMSVSHSPTVRPRLADLPAASRSRIANGRLGVDLRTAAGRRWRDCFLDLMHRTGGRSEQLCRSAASLIVRREALDAKIALGEDVPTDELLRLVSELRRTMTRLGLDADAEEPGEDMTAELLADIRAAEAA